VSPYVFQAQRLFSTQNPAANQRGRLYAENAVRVQYGLPTTFRNPENVKPDLDL